MSTMTAEPRTDVHRPSVIDPADYVVVGYTDDHETEGYQEWDWERYAAATGDGDADGDWRHFPDAFSDPRNWEGTSARCITCGQTNIRHWAFAVYLPTQKFVAVGHTCALKVGLASRQQLETHTAAEEWRRAEQAQARFATWIAEDESRIYMTLGMSELEGSDGFLDDLARGLARYGSLTERQEPHARRLVAELPARIAERQEEEIEETAPVIEGRIEITGKIVGLKTIDGYYGSTLKMLVRDDRGFKVWGTVPARINDALDGAEWLGNLRGERISFSATVEKSGDDECFGFFKRPTKAQVLAEEELKVDPNEEPEGAGADPYGRPDPLTHPEYWTE